MDFNVELTEEQKAKIRDCKTPEDILAVAKAEVYELSENELDEISGGGANWRCGGDHYGYVYITK